MLLNLYNPGSFSYTYYSYSYTPTTKQATIMIELQQDPSSIYIDAVSVLNSSSQQLLTNGGFETGSLAPWQHGTVSSGGVSSGCGYSGSYCYRDAIVGQTDNIHQTFATVPGSATGSYSTTFSVTVGDLNNDHRLDIAVANRDVRTLGIFGGETTYSTGINARPYCIATGDFNRDGRLDVVTANRGGLNLGVFLGFDGGALENHMTYSTSSADASVSVAFADFDRNNKTGIVVANFGTNNVDIAIQYGVGIFRVEISCSSSSNSNPNALAVDDLDNDSRQDIVVANYAADNIGAFLGFGNETFTDQVTNSTGIFSFPSSVVIGDFNNDNRSDIAITNYNAHYVSVFLTAPYSSFRRHITYSTCTDSGPYCVAVGDFNNDRLLDIGVANFQDNSVGIFLGFGDETFNCITKYSTDPYSYPMSVAIEDFNCDSRLDIAVVTCYDSNVWIFLGFGNGTFFFQLKCFTGVNSVLYSMVVGDFNNNNRLDIVVPNYGNNNIGVFLGYANETFAQQITYSTGAGCDRYCLTVSDFNNDNRLDIAVVNYHDNFIGMLEGFGDGTFGNKMIYPTETDSLSRSLVVADFNDDKLLDLVVANSDTSTVGVFFGYCCDPFRNQSTNDTGNNSHPSSVAVGNLNNYNQSDIGVANYGTNNIGILLGYRNGTFTKQTI
ncbi:unnamed protein product [Rotaria magnacalcarata]